MSFLCCLQELSWYLYQFPVLSWYLYQFFHALKVSVSVSVCRLWVSVCEGTFKRRSFTFFFERLKTYFERLFFGSNEYFHGPFCFKTYKKVLSTSFVRRIKVRFIIAVQSVRTYKKRFKNFSKIKTFCFCDSILNSIELFLKLWCFLKKYALLFVASTENGHSKGCLTNQQAPSYHMTLNWIRSISPIYHFSKKEQKI